MAMNIGSSSPFGRSRMLMPPKELSEENTLGFNSTCRMSLYFTTGASRRSRAK